MSILTERSAKPATRPAKQAIRDFLSKNETGVLATASIDGTPHVAVVYYFIDGLTNIRFITKRKTRKAEDIKRNNKAALIVYDEVSQTTLQVQGHVVEVTNEREASQAFRNALRASVRTAENAVPPISKMYAGDYVAFKLVPDEVKLAVFNRASSLQPPAGLFEVVSGTHLRM